MIDQEELPDIEGYQVITRRFFNGSFLLKHDLGKHVSLTHGGTFLSKSDYYYSQGPGGIFDSYEHLIRQYQYYGALNINPGEGFSIIPAFHYIDYSSPRLIYRERGFGSMFVVPASRANYYLGRLSVHKHIWLLDNGIGFSLSNLNGQTQYEADYNLVYYPFGNLNLYLAGSAYALLEEPSTLVEDMRFAGQGSARFQDKPGNMGRDIRACRRGKEYVY